MKNVFFSRATQLHLDFMVACSTVSREEKTLFVISLVHGSKFDTEPERFREKKHFIRKPEIVQLRCGLIDGILRGAYKFHDRKFSLFAVVPKSGKLLFKTKSGSAKAIRGKQNKTFRYNSFSDRADDVKTRNCCKRNKITFLNQLKDAMASTRTTES